ncbi:hypothetical protein NLJ89_g8365 [Agrocybe chaxingu]|uniref:Uncharacterized protein n=1 Tax=Agrocybe chaxingu TaxID=84603 RepID=A0A9W8MQU9_9AGAR|nr:hypothetical protein NLJ89_g8365 [Agrocybe chaxingu]
MKTPISRAPPLPIMSKEDSGPRPLNNPIVRPPNVLYCGPRRSHPRQAPSAYAHEVVAQADVDRNAILSEPDYMEEYCGDQLAASTLRAALLQLGFQPALIDKDYMPYVRSLSPLYLSHRNTSNYGKMIIEGRFERLRRGQLEVSPATSIRSRI